MGKPAYCLCNGRVHRLIAVPSHLLSYLPSMICWGLDSLKTSSTVTYSLNIRPKYCIIDSHLETSNAHERSQDEKQVLLSNAAKRYNWFYIFIFPTSRFFFPSPLFSHIFGELPKSLSSQRFGEALGPEGPEEGSRQTPSALLVELAELLPTLRRTRQLLRRLEKVAENLLRQAEENRSASHVYVEAFVLGQKKPVHFCFGFR